MSNFKYAAVFATIAFFGSSGCSPSPHVCDAPTVIGSLKALLTGLDTSPESVARAALLLRVSNVTEKAGSDDVFHCTAAVSIADDHRKASSPLNAVMNITHEGAKSAAWIAEYDVKESDSDSVSSNGAVVLKNFSIARATAIQEYEARNAKLRLSNAQNADTPPKQTEPEVSVTSSPDVQGNDSSTGTVNDVPTPSSSAAQSTTPQNVANGISGRVATAEDGRTAFKNNDYEEALRIWAPLADKGDSVAENGLGVLYSRGVAVPQDYGRAIMWWKAAAAQNYAAAEANLGSLYATDLAGARDYRAAMEWYRKAAQQGHAAAQFALGALISTVGEQHDYNEAAKWFSLAAAQGVAAAQYNLGILYLRAPNFPRNFARAYMWFDIAETSGVSNSDVGLLRDQAASKLTDGELAAAKEMEARCRASNFIDCN